VTGKNQKPSERVQKLLNFAGALGFVLILLGFALFSYRAGGVDFRGYYGAAVLVRRGGNPYQYQSLAPVLEEITGFQGNNPYFYPPWYSLLFVPLSFLPFQAARASWLLINLLLFYFALDFTRQVLNLEIHGWLKWLVYSLVFLLFGAYCLRSEQAGILLFFGFALALRAIKNRQPALAGLGIVLAASKPQATLIGIAVLVIWCMLNFRAAFRAAVGLFLVLLVISVLAIPHWWQIDLSGFGMGLTYGMDGVETVTSIRVNSTLEDFLSYFLGINGVWIWIIGSVLFVLGVLTIYFGWLWTRDPVVITGSGLLGTLLITPYALQYDYVPMIIPVMWIIGQFSKIRLSLAVFSILLFGLAFGVQVWQSWSYQGYLQVLIIFFLFLTILIRGCLGKPQPKN
jgi:hypothetical protein